MRNLSWKLGSTLLTFFIGTVLALVWVSLESKPAKSVEIALPVLPESKTPMPVAAQSPTPLTISNNTSADDADSNPPIRYVKGGGKFCEKYILKRIAREKSSSSRLAKLKNFNPGDETLSPNVKEWLEYMHKDKLLAFELDNGKQKALLLSSTSYGATGLATSLENWHIEIDSFNSNEFWSFSQNPRLVFWDKHGLLNYFSVVYSDDFLSATSERDYNKLTVNIERYQISLDGKAQLISEERNLRCE